MEGFKTKTKNQTPWLESACELYRPTERPPLVSEVSTNFSDTGCRVVSATIPPQSLIFGFLDRSRYFLEIASQLSSRG
jgi:hypothetical protein